MLHPSLVERITRSLAYMLRHQPEQFDLELDEYGYADLDDVVAALNERLGEPVESEDVSQAVENGDRPRYEVREGRIRALYGHSIQVKPGEPSKPPPLLYVGISRSDAERASRYGLRPGRRSFLHLALTPEDALETGRRASRDYAVVTVNAVDAWEEGINFYDRKSLYLSDPIPTHFLQVGDVQTDGYGDDEGGERGGRGPRRSEAPRGDAPQRDTRNEPPRRREWRDRPGERAPDRAPERAPDRAPDRAPERAPDRAPDRAPERAPGRAPERAPERSAERSHERPQERVGSGDGRGGHRGHERHGHGDSRGEPRGDHRPPRDDRSAPRQDRDARPERHDSPRGRPSESRPPSPSPREPARASSQPPAARPSSSDSFGLGVFEAEQRERASAPRAPESRPQGAGNRDESPKPAAEKPREPARAEADDSGFGAGL